ncbi:MAG: substrate-binding domain-containing protein [Candidatus Acidiferrales bacterium]
MGLIISDICNPFFPDIVRGFEEDAISRGWDFFLMNTNYDTVRMEHCVDRMIAQRVKGVAVMTSEFQRGLVDRLRDNAIPVVALDLGAVDQFVSNISIDYEDGIRQATEHLAAMGHRSIGFVCGSDRLRSHLRRRLAFESNAKKLGMAFKVVSGEVSDIAGENAVEALFTGSKPLTAIMTASDLIAFGVLRKLQTLRLCVPQQISVVGFDDIFFASITQPSLTTIALGRRELGKMALDALYRLSADSAHNGMSYQIFCRLVMRQSTGQRAKQAVAGSRQQLA